MATHRARTHQGETTTRTTARDIARAAYENTIGSHHQTRRLDPEDAWFGDPDEDDGVTIQEQNR